MHLEAVNDAAARLAVAEPELPRLVSLEELRARLAQFASALLADGRQRALERLGDD